MRAVIQRVQCAHVEVEGQTVGEIGCGLMILLGVEQGGWASRSRLYGAEDRPYAHLFR